MAVKTADGAALVFWLCDGSSIPAFTTIRFQTLQPISYTLEPKP